MPKSTPDPSKIDVNDGPEAAQLTGADLETGQMAIEAQRAQAAETAQQQAAGEAAGEQLRTLGPDAGIIPEAVPTQPLDAGAALGTPETHPETGRPTAASIAKVQEAGAGFTWRNLVFTGTAGRVLAMMKDGVSAAEVMAETAIVDVEHFCHTMIRNYGLKFEADGTGPEKTYKLLD